MRQGQVHFSDRTQEAVEPLVAALLDAIRHAVIDDLQTTPAFGVADDEGARSAWEELGCLLSTGSDLAAMAMEQLARNIRRRVLDVEPVDALALWLDHCRSRGHTPEVEVIAGGLVQLDPESLDEIVTKLRRRIATHALDAWDCRNSPRDTDALYLHGMLDGTVELLDKTLADKLEPMFSLYADDLEMMDLLHRAADAYCEAAVAAARRSLAPHENGSKT